MAGLETTPEMFDLRMSEEARPFYDKVVEFELNSAELTDEGRAKFVAEIRLLNEKRKDLENT